MYLQSPLKRTVLLLVILNLILLIIYFKPSLIEEVKREPSNELASTPIMSKSEPVVPIFRQETGRVAKGYVVEGKFSSVFLENGVYYLQLVPSYSQKPLLFSLGRPSEEILFRKSQDRGYKSIPISRIVRFLRDTYRVSKTGSENVRIKVRVLTYVNGIRAREAFASCDEECEEKIEAYTDKVNTKGKNLERAIEMVNTGKNVGNYIFTNVDLIEIYD